MIAPSERTPFKQAPSQERVPKEAHSTLQELQEKIANGEDVAETWKRLLIDSKKPSVELSAGMEMHILQMLHPVISQLPETPQDPQWHPEGDVWKHTLMVTDKAKEIAEQKRLDEEETEILILAAFCHDFGKPETTEINPQGRITAHGHEQAGVTPTKELLETTHYAEEKRKVIENLVAEHLAPSTLYSQETKHNQKIRDKTIRKLEKRLAPATIEQLVLLATADNLGRGPFPVPNSPEKTAMPTDYPAGEWLLRKYTEMKEKDRISQKEKVVPVIRGQDLIALGIAQGPAIGTALRIAKKMVAGGLSREEILEKITKRLEQKDDTPENILKDMDQEFTQ